MTSEEKLDLLLGRATPPPRDFVFTSELARRVTLRRIWWRLAAMLPWLGISCVLLWAMGPFLIDLWPKLASAMAVPVAALSGSALLATSALWLTHELRRRR